MGPAFDQTIADFSKMRPVPPCLYMSAVKHKSFIEVNEEGTEVMASVLERGKSVRENSCIGHQAGSVEEVYWEEFIATKNACHDFPILKEKVWA
jgi:serine protease inhibitor